MEVIGQVRTTTKTAQINTLTDVWTVFAMLMVLVVVVELATLMMMRPTTTKTLFGKTD